MNKKLTLAPLIPFLFISCAQTYNAPSGGTTAKLNTFGGGEKWICVNNKIQKLISDSQHYATIPAGDRITVGTEFYADNGYVITKCSPRSSFIPQPNLTYYIDFEIENEKCTSLVYKEDKSNRAGLSLEATLQRSNECRN